MIGLLIYIFSTAWLIDAAFPPPCILPMKAGPCRIAIPRYYYNMDSCRCERFAWGGCEGNANNFDDLASCQSSCDEPIKSNSDCSLPQVTGNCTGYLPRYWFNTTSCKCERFIYRGCGANANNFPSLEWCNSICQCYKCDNAVNICKLPFAPRDAGMICAAAFPVYGYNNKTCQCEKFIYSGCLGNENRFSTLNECMRRCDVSDCTTGSYCDMPADPGPCNANFRRFYYNTKTCKCEQFRYSGCRGNRNNFRSLENCERECQSRSKCKGEKNRLSPVQNFWPQ